jgi:D-galactarolactone cycloisomerase
LVGPNAGSRGSSGRGGGYDVRIATTDQGAAGWAMCHGEDEAYRKVVGTRMTDVFDIGEGVPHDIWPLERVLHDLAGNILNVPVWRLIGGAGPREVFLYSGAIYFDDLLPLDKPRGVAGVLASCRQDHEAGYRAFKLKIGRGFKWMDHDEGLKRDIEVTRAVHEKFPDSRVLVDANNAYTVEDAIQYVKAVADCNLYWIEEPFWEKRDDLKRLKDAMAKADCNAMIAEGETRRSHAEKLWAYGGYTKEFIDNLYALGAEKLVDIILLDLGIVGFSRWRKIMPELAKAGLKASPHTWAWTPRTYYTAHLAAGVGNIPIVEGIPGKAGGVDYSAYKMTDGKLVMPDAPGFGLKLV